MRKASKPPEKSLADQPRRILWELIEQSGKPLSYIAQTVLKRGPAYLRNYLHGNSPHRLDYMDAERLGEFFGVSPRLIATGKTDEEAAIGADINEKQRIILSEGVVVLMEIMRSVDNTKSNQLLHKRFWQAVARCQKKKIAEPQKIRDVFESYLDAE